MVPMLLQFIVSFVQCFVFSPTGSSHNFLQYMLLISGCHTIWVSKIRFWVVLVQASRWSRWWPFCLIWDVSASTLVGFYFVGTPHLGIPCPHILPAHIALLPGNSCWGPLVLQIICMAPWYILCTVSCQFTLSSTCTPMFGTSLCFAACIASDGVICAHTA